MHPFYIFMGIVLVIMVLGYFGHRFTSNQMSALFEDLARKHGGEVLPATLLTLPRWKVDLGGVEGIISAQAGGGSKSGKNQSQTYIYIQQSVPEERCWHLRPEVFGHSFVKVLGFQDIQVGDEAFDKKFVLQGKDEEAVRGMLDEGLRSQLLAAKRDFSVNVQPDRVSVHMHGMSLDDATAEWLLKTALMIRQRLA